MVRRPGWTLLLVALITGLATWSALSIRPDYDPRSFHPVGNEFVEATRAAEAVFGTDDRNALIGVFAPTGGLVLTVDGLAHIHALTDALERLEGVESVMSVTTARTVTGTADTVDIAPLLTEL
ncbi:MAG: putative RND superfamily exporter protein, partial [Myxococcota bacterium]